MLKVIKNLSNIAVSIFLWAVTALMTFAVFIFCVVAIAVAFPFDRKRKLVHTAGFWWADAIIGVNPFWGFRMKGRENIDYKKTYVLISNHQSMADIVMVYKTRMQFKWVAKDKLFRIPVFGWCMRMMKYINLERGEHGSIRQAYEKAGEWLRSGVSVLFFPEGTRSNSEEMNPFKNGAFKLAIKEKRPILPIVLHGSRNVIPRGSWIFKVRTESSLIVLPEVDTSNYTEEDFAKLRDLVYNMLKEAYKNANDHRPDFSRPAAG